MLKNLFRRNNPQKQQSQNNVAAEKGEPSKPTPTGHEPVKGGTLLRSTEPMDTIEKNKSLLQLAEEGAWEVKNVPEYHIGDTIDDTYKIAKKFSGGMGFVYITEPTGQSIRFAIKQPNRMMLENKSFFARIIREADTWNELGMHPNIAYCYFVKLVDEIPCIFIEYVEGGNLREWIADGQCLDIRASLDMAIQFCHGMEHAHKKGVIHRDIKPENVLMTKDGGVKITDFGLAGALEGTVGKVGAIKGGALTQFGSEMGTHEYMSPEQWEDAHIVDERADIFSFGVCLWEMFCGKRPYKIAYGDDIETPTPAQTLRPELTTSHVELLYKCIELDKAKRYKDFAELREALNRIYHELYDEYSPSFTIELPDSLADELNNRGYSYYQLGDEQKAIQCWEGAIKKDPEHLESNFNHGYAKWKKGKTDDVKFLATLSDLNLDQSGSILRSGLLCMIHLERGDLYSARACITNCPETIDFFSPNYKTKYLSLLQGALHNTDIQKYKSTSLIFNNNFCINSIETNESVWSIDYCAKSKIMLSSGDGYIQLWDTLTGTLIKSFENHIGRLVRFSNDGEFIIVASGKKIFKLETNSGTCIKEFHEHSSSIDCISVSSDNKYLASVCDNGEGRIWNIKNGKIINTFIGYNTVHFSPDGHSILTSKGLNLLEYKISSGLLERVFLSDIKKGYWIWSAIYSSDGKYIISASYDNTVKLWDRVLSKCFYIFDAPNTRSIAISPSCNILVTGDSKGILKIWDLCTYRCICTLNHHNNIISSLIFFGDNKHLVSGSIDKSIRIWEIGYPFKSVCNFILSLPTSASDKQEIQKYFNQLLLQAESLINIGDLQNAYKIVRKAQSIKGFQHDEKVFLLISKIKSLKILIK